jgi:hypothetical protein
MNNAVEGVANDFFTVGEFQGEAVFPGCGEADAEHSTVPDTTQEQFSIAFLLGHGFTQ